MNRSPDWRIATVLVAAGMLSACVPNVKQQASMHDLLHSGRIMEAANIVEQQDTSESDVLASLNKGMLRRMTQDYRASNRIFEKAKRRIEELYGVSVTEQLGAVTVNDTLRKYSGDRYEQVLVHAYMALNYMELGLPDSARVEILQADIKMKEWGEQPEEDPFVRYLSGIIYEMLGEDDEAIIAYRKAVQIYRETTHKQNVGIPRQLRADLLNALHRQGRKNEYNQKLREFGMSGFKPAPRNQGSVVVVLNQGTAPRRSENAIQTFATDIQHIVRIALPQYKTPAPNLKAARLQVAGNDTALETVENIDALARHALKEDMPAITARAIARAVIKHQANEKAREKSDFAGFLTKITNLVTERADTRSWSTLPQEIQLARVYLPAGEHPLAINIKNSAGYTVDSIQRKVAIKPRQTNLVSAHWVAPVVQLQTAQTKK